MPPSATAAVGAALERTRRVLFEPFDGVKWLKLGFCAFLAYLGEGGYGVSYGNWSGERFDAEPAREWLVEHLRVLLLIGVPLLLIALVVWAVLLWVRCRGRFMFLDGVLKNRGAVVEPWSAFHGEADSLFVFSLVLQLGAGLLLLLWIGLCVLIAWPDIEAERFGAFAAAGLALGVITTMGVSCLMLLVDVLLADFVVPAMHARRVRTLAGWRIVLREVVAAHPGDVFLYLLLRVVLVIAICVLILGLLCATLCCAACCLALPYVGTLLLLPVLVFMRSYPLCFLEQLGGPWRLFTWPARPAEGQASS